MKIPENRKGLTRPFADNHRASLLDSPVSSFGSAKRGRTPFMRLDCRMILDPGISATLKGVLLYLLNYAPTWEHAHIVKEIQDQAWVNDKTARKYLNALIEAGYIHPVAYADSDHKWVRRYKITELPIRPGSDEDPNPKKPVLVAGLQTSKAQRIGFPEHAKKRARARLHSPVSTREMLKEAAAIIAERREERREVGLEAWKAKQQAKKTEVTAAAKDGRKDPTSRD